MDINFANVIKLISSVIDDTDCEILDVSDNLLNIAQKHHIVTMLYYAMHDCGVKIPDEIQHRMQQIVLAEAVVNEQQLYCIDEIGRIFAENNIDYMFLKGSVLKKYYPRTEMRRMGDIDILIREEQYRKITEIMTGIGFVFKYESDHELVWRRGNVTIELHKILMPSYNTDLHGYFGNGWKRAVLQEKNRYTFSDNDMLIYIFSHFAKHYRDTGIGIIHMCDLYFVLKNFNLDFDYIDKELEKLHLRDFWHNVKATLDVWFNGAQSTDMTDYITAVIFNSGVYGLKENSVLSMALKSEKTHKNLICGKIYRIFHMFFPTYSSMKRKYPALVKSPYLLPYFWVCRWVRLLFTRRKDIKNVIGNIYAVPQSDVEIYHNALNYVGLDYNFEDDSKKEAR